MTEAHAAAPDLSPTAPPGRCWTRVRDGRRRPAPGRAAHRLPSPAGRAPPSCSPPGAAVVGGLLAAAVGVAAGGLAPGPARRAGPHPAGPARGGRRPAGRPAGPDPDPGGAGPGRRAARPRPRAAGGGGGPSTAGAGAGRPRTTSPPAGRADRTVVDDLDLDVRAGERVALVGPSGSGKTTVAATLLGLLPPRAGTVERVRRRSAIWPRTPTCSTPRWPRTSGSAAATPTDADLRRRARAGGARPADLDRLVGEHGSQALRRRGAADRAGPAAARASTPCVILDEPTEHLDRPDGRRPGGRPVRAATAEAAVLVITHDPALIARCDRVVTLGPARVPVG